MGDRGLGLWCITSLSTVFQLFHGSQFYWWKVFVCKFLFQHIFFLAILADSARKRNKKEVFANYNKTRINIGHQHDRWMELKEALRHKCKHQCHCACSSEIGTFIINDAGRQAAHKKQPKYMFWSNLAKRRFILMFWRYILTFNAKKTFKRFTKLTRVIPLNQR